MRRALLVCLTVGLLGLVGAGTAQTYAQDIDTPPAHIELIVDRLTLDQGQSSQALLVLCNTSSYTLTNVTAEFQGTAFLG